MRNEEYPVNREWKQKAFSMPKLPGGDDGLEKTLYTILQMVKEGQSFLKSKEATALPHWDVCANGFGQSV